MEQILTYDPTKTDTVNAAQTQRHLLSIVIPIYNAEKQLKTCVDSILSQTFPNLEVLLIDDGSKDSSPRICDEYERADPRCKAIHKKNGGCSSARNLGITQASGDLIAFVDADDYIDPEMFQILIQNLDLTGSDVSVCGYRRESESDSVNIVEKQRTDWKLRVMTDTDIYVSITRKENSIEGMVWNKVWKREVIGEHRYRTDVAINDDAVFTWETLKNAAQVCYCDLPMYHYVVLSTGIVRSSKTDNYLKGLHGYEIMMEDARSIAESCFKDLSWQYIVWNVTTFEQLTMQDRPDKMEIYKKLKQNILGKKAYLDKIPFQHRVIAVLITKNYHLASAMVRVKRTMKKIVK